MLETITKPSLVAFFYRGNSTFNKQSSTEKAHKILGSLVDTQANVNFCYDTNTDNTTESAHKKNLQHIISLIQEKKIARLCICALGKTEEERRRLSLSGSLLCSFCAENKIPVLHLPKDVIQVENMTALSEV